MLAMRDHDELPHGFPLDETGERPGLAPGAEWTHRDPLAVGSLGTDVDEEMTLLGRGSRHELREAAVLRQAQVRKSPPLESADAQNQARCHTSSKELDTEALSRLASREDEDRIRHSAG
jgi:hypothetical protein